MKKNWGKRILLVIGLILVLLLVINLLLTYTLNYILGKQIIPKINNEQRQLSLISSVSIFPSATININNLSYYQDKKNLITIEHLSMQVDFWQLFKGKLYINKISINQARLNLYNIPSLTWKKSTRPYKGMKEQTPSQHSTQAQKNTLTSSHEASFFKISKIELNELKIYYSTPKTSAPLYFNSITYKYRQASENEIDLKGLWQENPLSAKVLVNLVSSYPVIKADINFANNTLNLIAQWVDNSYQLQTNIRINNPVPLANLFSIKDDQLPQQVHSVFKVLGNKLIIPAFEAIYSTARLEATLGPDGSNSYVTNITLPEDLLLKFFGTTFTHCPLPQPVNAFIKGMNTQIKINFTKASQEKSTLILIDGSGIHFEGSSLPEVVQKNFQTCFDYPLEDESIQTTYTIN